MCLFWERSLCSCLADNVTDLKVKVFAVTAFSQWASGTPKWEYAKETQLALQPRCWLQEHWFVTIMGSVWRAGGLGSIYSVPPTTPTLFSDPCEFWSLYSAYCWNLALNTETCYCCLGLLGSAPDYWKVFKHCFSCNVCAVKHGNVTAFYIYEACNGTKFESICWFGVPKIKILSAWT